MLQHFGHGSPRGVCHLPHCISAFPRPSCYLVRLLLLLPSAMISWIIYKNYVLFLNCRRIKHPGHFAEAVDEAGHLPVDLLVAEAYLHFAEAVDEAGHLPVDLLVAEADLPRLFIVALLHR